MTIIEAFPTGFASLSDGSTTIPFIFTDGQGKKNPLSFRSDPYPRTALKTISGESKYSDLEPPYFAIPQDDWTGGRGNEDFENDTSRYLDGWRIDTSKESGAILGGRETYSTGYHNVDQAMPGDVSLKRLYSDQAYLAMSFVASASYTTYKCEVWLRKYGSPGDLSVELWSNVSSEPGAMLCTKTITAANITTDVISVFKDFAWTGAGSNEDITSGTTYWVVVHNAGSDNLANHWGIGAIDSAGGKKSTDGSTWLTSIKIYFRITPAAANFVGKFFEYKGALFLITQPEAGGNSGLWVNGDFGVADSNSGNKSNLEDASKSWTNDEFIGAKVLITKGPGSEEEEPWRSITDNDSNSLVCSPDWNITHTTSTEYVILGSDKWTQLDANLGAYITDVAVAGEYIWMARGGASGDTGIYWRRYYATGGTWTMEEEDTTNTLISDKILNVKHPNEGEIIYSSTSNHTKNGVSIYKGKVPKSAIAADDWLFYPVYEFDTDVPWNSQTIANVTNQVESTGYTQISIADGHTTGLAAVMNLDSPLNVRRGQSLVAEVYSTVALDANDYRFVYDDVEDMGKYWSPVKVLLADYGYNTLPSKVFLEADADGTPAFTDLTETYDGDALTVDAVSFTTDDYLWIGGTTPFNKCYIDLGSTKNANTCTTIYYEYYSENNTGTDLANISDGTINTANTPLEQSGLISFTLPPNGGRDSWKPLTVNEVEAYWIRIRYQQADLTASVDLKTIYLTVDANDSMTPLFYDLTNTYDGTTITHEKLTFATEDFLYVGYGTKFNSIGVDIGTANDIASVLTAQYFDGGQWTSITITDGTDVSGDTLKKTASIGYISFTLPSDWEANTVNSTEAYWIRLDVSNALSTEFSIEEITVTRQKNVYVALPAIPVSTWTTVMISTGTEAFQPDKSTIKSIGLNVSVDKGACVFSIRKLWLANITVDARDETAYIMPSDKRITGLQAYAGNVDDPILNPWIFTTDAVYEMQTQNNDQIVKIPLEELGSLSSPENGLGHCVNGTYLYFNVGEKIERYFNRTLDDIGPDRDEGLPDDRPGIPKSLASYPGRVLAGIDAGASGTSSVLRLDGSAWHEVYRAPRAGERIRSIYIQAIPGTNVDRLWISMGSDILWVPISLNPYNETDYTFTHEGVLTTSWIYAKLIDVQKTWKSLTIFSDGTDSNQRCINVDYQVDTDTTWTEIGEFTTAPTQEFDIASTLPQAKRIRYRLRIISELETKSPRLKAMVTEGVAFVPVKTKYSWTFVISKDSQNIDLKGKWDSDLTSLQKRDQLLTWANAGTPLTMRHYSAVYDNKTVWVDPASVAPLRIVAHEDIENHVTQLSCFDY